MWDVPRRRLAGARVSRVELFKPMRDLVFFVFERFELTSAAVLLRHMENTAIDSFNLPTERNMYHALVIKL